MAKRLWTDDELALLRAKYPEVRTQVIEVVDDKYMARVFIEQARGFRLRRNASSQFAHVLLRWAGERRRAIKQAKQLELSL